MIFFNHLQRVLDAAWPPVVGIISQVPAPQDLTLFDFVNLGFISFFCLGILRGWVVSGREFENMKEDRAIETEERKKAEVKFDEHLDRVNGEILPQLFETTRVLGDVTSTLADVQKLANDIKHLLED